jgi:hypothetical protein
MGWSSGTALMWAIIDAAKVAINDHETRVQFYKEVIDAFEDHDWDCQSECLGGDAAYDEALNYLHPDW